MCFFTKKYREVPEYKNIFIIIIIKKSNDMSVIDF